MFSAFIRALCFALALFPALALAQMPTLPGFPPGVFQSRGAIDGSSSTPFSITNTSSNSSTTAGTSFTFTSQSIGSADQTRIVLVALTSLPQQVQPSSVTIGGTNAANVSGAFCTETSGAISDIWFLAVPTGTTATVVVNYAASVSRQAIAVYSAIGTSVAISTGANNPLTSGTANTKAATIPSGGGAIAIVGLHSTETSFTPTNLTTDVNNVTFGISSFSAGHNSSSSGSTTMGWSWSATNIDSCLSIATLSP